MPKKKKKLKVKTPEGEKTEGQKKREAFNQLKMDPASLRKSQKKKDQKRNAARSFKDKF